MSVAESKESLKAMTTPDFRKEMSALVRSRAPLVYLVTTEEKRVIEYFRHFSTAGGYNTLIWDCLSGLLKITTMEPAGLISGNQLDPCEALDWILKEATEAEAAREAAKDDEAVTRGNIYILLDFHRFLKPCSPDVERRLRTLSRMDSNTVVIMTGPNYEATAALDKDVRVIDFPYPNKDEIKIALYTAVDSVAVQAPELRSNVEAREEEIVNSVSGLTFTETVSALAKSICMHKDLHIPTILKEKQEVIRKTGILQYFNPGVGIDDVGGLGNLVDFLRARKSVFSEEAREYGLPLPKGVLMIGVPGSGKSLAAKAAASLYEMPLLRLDFGALFGSLMGESEQKARMALQIAERVSPCILWVDEIEKGLSGHQSSGRSDSGTTNRVIATFLTWLQEKTAPVFFVCTANQHDQIPPEFMRAGRFDEIFFVDLPTMTERKSILEKLLNRKKRDPKEFGLSEIAARSEGYTGAELEKAIDNALLVGFHDGRRPIVTADIIDALGKFKPLSVLRPEAIETMRAWAENRCLKANTPETIPGANMSAAPKKLDLNEV